MASVHSASSSIRTTYEAFESKNSRVCKEDANDSCLTPAPATALGIISALSVTTLNHQEGKSLSWEPLFAAASSSYTAHAAEKALDVEPTFEVTASEAPHLHDEKDLRWEEIFATTSSPSSKRTELLLEPMSDRSNDFGN